MSRQDQEYWEDRHAQLAPHLAVGDPGLGERFNAWMYRVRRRVFLRAVHDLVDDPARARVLDAACGFGFYTGCWLGAGARDVTAADYAPAALARVRERHPGVRTLRFDLGAERPPDAGPFDAISAFDVLFHLTDDGTYRRAVANLAGLLRPGGLLLVSENLRTQGHHVTALQVDRSEAETLGVLAACGLRPVLRRPMFRLMNEPHNSRRPLDHRRWAAQKRALRARPALGDALGALLYPLELVLVRRDGPGVSTDLLACRREPG